MKKKAPLLEICVDSVASVVAAKEGGADRIELCGHLMIGGVTPSTAFFKEAQKVAALPINVMIRPRFGDFCYTEEEVRIMEEEIAMYRKLGAGGVVFGVLTPDGHLNMPAMERLCEAAGDMERTLHRAFDVSADPLRTLEEAVLLGMDTILTSGQKACCIDGMPLLKELYTRADARVDLMAGAGLKPEMIPKLHAETGITSYHMSAAVRRDSEMRYRNEEVHMGLKGLSEYAFNVCSAEIVAKAKQLIKKTGYTPPE